MNSHGALVITPFILFAFFEIISLWPSAIFAYYTGQSEDAYPIIIVALGFFCLLCGFSLIRRLRRNRFNYRSPKTFLYLHIELPFSITRCSIGIILTFLFLLGISLYHYRGIPPVSSSFMASFGLHGSGTDLLMQESRKILTKDHLFGGAYRGQGLISSFMYVGWPFLLAVSLAIYYKTKKRSWLLTSILFLFFTFIFVAGDGTRAPFLYAIIYLVVVISMFKRLKMRFLFILSVFLIVMTIVLSIITGRLDEEEWSIKDALQKTAERVALDNGMDTIYVIEFVRSGVLDYQYGAINLQKAILALPGTAGGQPFSHRLSFLLGKRSTTSFASTTYLATIFIDFGIIGVVLFYLMFGCVFGLAQQLLYNVKKNASNACSGRICYLLFG
ncbi:MAG: hypothetical protein SCABRO_00221 [Candidatus Scalindua brodae]|uniref:Oligosaccharide repeat unit polymerase n=1 Tax=Candidatus Scalindua brodae TaxID=237368 RepID=A0A0B0ELU7_9BACT|nr:MAG: hypothetical protein SCABRO_00221 [Candidatus Scalindua brodae]